MGVEIPVGFGQMKLRWRLNTYPNDFIVTCGFSAAALVTLQDAVDDWSDAAEVSGGPGAAPQIPPGWSWRGVEGTLMTSTGPVSAEKTRNLPGTGSAPFPPNVSFLVKKITARGGRAGRGRMFVPAMAVGESNITPEGLIETSPFNSFSNSWNAYFTAVDATDAPPVLLHSDGSTPDPITAFQAQQLVCTQRRRLAR